MAKIIKMPLDLEIWEKTSIFNLSPHIIQLALFYDIFVFFQFSIFEFSYLWFFGFLHYPKFFLKLYKFKFGVQNGVLTVDLIC